MKKQTEWLALSLFTILLTGTALVMEQGAWSVESQRPVKDIEKKIEGKVVVITGASGGLKADIELIRPEDINRAYERVVNKDVRYRLVIDIASLKAAL
jgi:hypothetical protein